MATAQLSPDPTIAIVPDDQSPSLMMMILGPLVRHGLTTAGGWLVGQGVIDKSDTAAFVGGGMVVAGVVWSWWQKHGQKLAIDELQWTVGTLKGDLFRQQEVADANAKAAITQSGLQTVQAKSKSSK